jgi:hypothetical protein
MNPIVSVQLALLAIHQLLQTPGERISLSPSRWEAAERTTVANRGSFVRSAGLSRNGDPPGSFKPAGGFLQVSSHRSTADCDAADDEACVSGASLTRA